MSNPDRRSDAESQSDANMQGEPESQADPRREGLVDPCERFEDWLIEFRGREVPPAMRVHVSACPGCSELLATIEHAGMVGDALAGQRPDAAFKAALLADVMRAAAAAPGAGGPGDADSHKDVDGPGDAISTVRTAIPGEGAYTAGATVGSSIRKRRLAALVAVAGLLLAGALGLLWTQLGCGEQPPAPVPALSDGLPDSETEELPGMRFPVDVPLLETELHKRLQAAFTAQEPGPEAVRLARASFHSPYAKIRNLCFSIFIKAKENPPKEAVYAAFEFFPEHVSQPNWSASIQEGSPSDARAAQLARERGLTVTWALDCMLQSIYRGVTDWDVKRVEPFLWHENYGARQMAVKILVNMPGYKPTEEILDKVRNDIREVRRKARAWFANEGKK